MSEGCETIIGGYRVVLARTPDLASDFFGLTGRETEVLDHIMRGLTIEQAALRMDISPSTAKTYKRRSLDKMEVSNISTAIVLYAAYCAGADVIRLE